MPYEADDYLSLIYEYIKTDAGQKEIEKSGAKQISKAMAYDRTTMKKIAFDLKNDIIAAFLAMVKDPHAVFNYGDVKVTPTRDVDGIWTISIIFGDKALWRPSLFNPHTWTQTGKGVQDIFELFTHGVNYPSYVYGIWMREDGTGQMTDAGSEGIVRSCRKRAANNFINKVMERYRGLYPGISFKWPTEWGGNN